MYMRIPKWLRNFLFGDVVITKGRGLFCLLELIVCTCILVCTIASIVKDKKSIERNTQILNEQIIRLNESSKKQYYIRTRNHLIRLELETLKGISMNSPDSMNSSDSISKEISKGLGAVFVVEEGLSDIDQETETSRQEVYDLKTKLQRLRKLNIIRTIIAFIDCIVLLFCLLPMNFTFFMLSIYKSFEFKRKIEEVELLDIFRYNFANITSFGNVDIYPITLGAKIMVLSEHILGIFFIIILITTILELLLTL